MNFDSSAICNVIVNMLEKPAMIKDYDHNMGCVDRYGKQLQTYYNERKKRKWLIK
jgi:hypothetical protein